MVIIIELYCEELRKVTACKCDIDLIQQFIKHEVNIKRLILSDYNTFDLFSSISSMKIVSNKVQPLSKYNFLIFFNS